MELTKENLILKQFKFLEDVFQDYTGHPQRFRPCIYGEGAHYIAYSSRWPRWYFDHKGFSFDIQGDHLLIRHEKLDGPIRMGHKAVEWITARFIDSFKQSKIEFEEARTQRNFDNVEELEKILESSKA